MVISLRPIHRFAHVQERRIDIDAGFELDENLRRAVKGEAVHFGDALNGLQLQLRRADQQALAVFRRYARQRQSDDHERRRDVGIGFARD